jgi:hypothetical protein
MGSGLLWNADFQHFGADGCVRCSYKGLFLGLSALATSKPSDEDRLGATAKRSTPRRSESNGYEELQKS